MLTHARTHGMTAQKTAINKEFYGCFIPVHTSEDIFASKYPVN
jgi:hypothetical protein